MKKIVGMFIVMLLIMTAIPTIGVKINSKLESSDLPEYFNWMDHEGQDWTTPPKNQYFPQYCGSCYIFDAIGALESVINIKEGIPDLDPDLSEQYVLSCLPGIGGCWGGVSYSVLEYIKRDDDKGNNCNGIIPEACFPYKADDTIPCESKCDNWDDYLIPILDFGRARGIDTIKSNIMQYGPVAADMMYLDNFSIWIITNHSPDDYFPYEEGYGIGHGVLIVGWKDDPSIGKGGYWICKDSDGRDVGYNGFFNIEYESCSMASWTFWVDYDPESYDWHPVPKINGPYYGLVNDPLQFQGDASGEHPPFTYHWDFGDDSYSEDQNPTHTYTSEGEYDVILTVTDDEGNSFYDKTYAWVQVTNQPPNTPILEGPSEVAAGEDYDYNVTLYDPDTPIIYYKWEIFGYEKGVWSDGIFSSEEKRGAGWIAPEERGDYSIRCKVMDPYGAESDWGTLTVTVSKNKLDFNTTLQQFLENHPRLYQLFQRLLKL
jgi:hypothetical protein